jgi:hypothetical protein
LGTDPVYVFLGVPGISSERGGEIGLYGRSGAAASPDPVAFRVSAFAVSLKNATRKKT